VIPTATFVNALVWHLAPSLTQGHIAPGLYSALLLYVPLSTAALIESRRLAVSGADIATGATLGVAIALGVPLLARLV